MEEMFGITNWLEQVNDEDVNFIGSVFKLLLSMVLGAMVGLERRHKGQIAGMRTFALISMGATLAMLVSIYIPQEYLGLKNGDFNSFLLCKFVNLVLYYTIPFVKAVGFCISFFNSFLCFTFRGRMFVQLLSETSLCSFIGLNLS